MTPANVRNVMRKDPNNEQKLQTDLEDSLRASFIDDKPAVQKALDRVASRSNQDINGDGLITRLAREGVVPKADGEVSDFSDFFKYVESEEARIGGQINRRLQQESQVTSLNDIRQAARDQIVNDPYVGNVASAERAIDNLMDSFERRYGTELSPVQVNEIRKATNRITKSFDKEDFDLDAAAAVGNAARTRIDLITKSNTIREANSRLADLYLMRDAAIQLHRRKIDTGEVAKTLGSFMGTVAAGATGLAVAGPGGLVVAYLAARMGSKALADLIRNMRFGDKNREAIIKALRKDPTTVKQLINEADDMDREILKRALLPAAGQSSAPDVIPLGARTPSDGISVEPAAPQSIRGEGGRFARGFTQQTERQAAETRQQLAERQNVSSDNSITPKTGERGMLSISRIFGDLFGNKAKDLPASAKKIMREFEMEGDNLTIRKAQNMQSKLIKDRTKLINAGASLNSNKVKALDESIKAIDRELQRLSE